MKKLVSAFLVFALILSLGIIGVATGETETIANGTIKITNATVGQTYKVYKVFDASYNETNQYISYGIIDDPDKDKTCDFYDALFDANGDPVEGNRFFVYNKSNHNVIKAEGVLDAELINYLTGIINAPGTNFPMAADSIEATGKTVIFSGLPYGYYVVISSLGTVVTITSNAPNAEVIDKNQQPGSGFQKMIWDKTLNGGAGGWAESNTAEIGEIVKYQVSFNATNYFGSEQIKYYTITDVKGSALWVEFGNKNNPTFDISVKVGNRVLKRGYYLPVGSVASSNPSEWEWMYLGDWSDIPEAQRDCNDAQWYLVHYGYDEFQIVIPWLSNHTVTGEQATVYGWDFATDATSLYDSSESVVIEYYASVEPEADIGGGKETNLVNRATLRWTCTHDSGMVGPATVYTEVFGLGILKVDSANGAALAGAEFKIYADEACTQPVYVIPTDIAGVYIVDDMNAEGQTITGKNKQTAREFYKNYRDSSWGENEQRNVVVTPINGKVVIRGLDKGTYYLKETKAPNGYNSVATATPLEVGTGTTEFYVYADENGAVADVQAADAIFTEKTYKVTKTTVENSQGQVLPSTGGEGTFILITLGTLLAIGFAVLLITHKKMSVYVD